MYTRKVKEFAQACETKIPERPILMSKEKINFIRQMVRDEMEELAEAKNVTDQADALVDAIYYICDTAVKHGINLDPLFNIVHQANMKKIVKGRVIKRKDGKILKPKGWQDPAPLLAEEIERQKQNGAF